MITRAPHPLLVLLTLAACAAEPVGPPDGDGQGDGDGDTVDLTQYKGWESLHVGGAENTYYSGFDGTNPYVVPMTFFAPTQPQVTFGDATVAQVNGPILTLDSTVVPEIPPGLTIQVLFVKTLKAGSTTITATAGDISETATLQISQYTPQDVTLGEQRYNEGAQSCAGCHSSMSVHNPGILADLSDDTILGIAVDGDSIMRINPETAMVETVQPNGGAHMFTVTAAERVGLMAYLRSRDFRFQLPVGGL